MFPTDAKTITAKMVGVSQTNILTSPPYTIMGIRMQQSGSQSETIVYCGSVEIGHNYSKDYPLDLMNYVCNNTVSINKTGSGDESFVSITYTNYDTNKISSSTPMIYNGFTGGELVISIFAFLIFVSMLFMYTWNRLTLKN